MTVLPWAEADQAAATALLNRHKATSLFLLNNLDAYGPVLTEHLNSANMRVIERDGRVTAVFALARRGNLLVQTDRTHDETATILDACAAEPVPLTGILGDWALAEPLWRAHVERRPDFETTACARDVLFELELDPTQLPTPPAAVRQLTEADFERWDALTAEFLAGEGLPMQGTLAQRRDDFLGKVAKRQRWGYEADGAIVSIAGYNAQIEGTAQVGGVFTLPAYRRRGLSKAVMQALIADGARLHGLSTLVLFTGENNLAAQAMYRSLGFREIGEYALIFGEYRQPITST
jgi:predicted GNAT family acetyltransferase